MKPWRLLPLLMLLAAQPAAAAIQARLLASNPAPYVGEAVLLTLEIRRPGQVAAPLRPLWPPLTDLLLVEELPGQVHRLDTASDTVIEHLRRVVRPLRAGQIPLEGAGVVQNGRRIAARGVTLHVRALPQKGRPQQFAGAVGRLAYATRTDPATGTLLLELSGDTDLRQLPGPVAGDGITALPLLASDQDGHWPTWRRTLRYHLPANGEVRLRLAWFDPADGRYHTSSDRRSRRSWLIWAGLAALAAFPVWLVCRWRKVITLDRYLRTGLAGLPYDTRLRLLCRAGVAAHLLEELARHWRQADLRFAADTSPGAGRRQRSDIPAQLLWKMAAGIDKRRLHRP
ncbi:hypothetical protein EDC39_10773 [Geothermobacter ehrlichii]|uniref:Oxygen tolerance protein BatD n=1 Tax=Geothermobacter ehrlichii TaxID=213224 RepID=A0A5D3WJA0_9BACT|nr:protein BatD [Geothermobacter ehrlichii]TYO98278.1 hypothetical protein EDC39_10773 [Geothermobacter ehrlichii]